MCIEFRIIQRLQINNIILIHIQNQIKIINFKTKGVFHRIKIQSVISCTDFIPDFRVIGGLFVTIPISTEMAKRVQMFLNSRRERELLYIPKMS